MWLGIFSGSQFEETLDNTQHGEKQNKCNQCDYASSQASNLRTHFKTHSGEKSNKCDQCDFACWLRTHLKTHSGEKQNKCNQCDYASSQASNLRTHLKTHSGEKSNKCDQCDFECWLRTHLKTRNRENSNKCPEGKCTTTISGNLWGHSYFGANYTELVWRSDSK